MKAIFIGALAFLSACAANGPSYDSLEIPSSKGALFVIYRPESFKFALRTPAIEINGKKACDLPNGSFFISDLPFGEKIISASFWDMPGTSKLHIKTTKQQTYYVRIAVSDDKFAAGLVGGIAGMAIAEGLAENTGPLSISLVDKKLAELQLSKLKMNKNCQ